MSHDYPLCLSLQLFITQRNYPKHNPVTIVTEGGETWQFCAHFEWWLDVRLELSPLAERLRLGSEVNEPEINYPAIGQTKVQKRAVKTS